MDSLMAVEFKNRIEFDMECSLPTAVVMEIPIVEGLSEYLIRQINLGSTTKAPEEEGEWRMV